MDRISVQPFGRIRTASGCHVMLAKLAGSDRGRTPLLFSIPMVSEVTTEGSLVRRVRAATKFSLGAVWWWLRVRIGRKTPQRGSPNIAQGKATRVQRVLTQPWDMIRSGNWPRRTRSMQSDICRGHIKPCAPNGLRFDLASTMSRMPQKKSV